MVPIHNDGTLFGYRGRIINALDAASGERIWRSREPGDGLAMVIDDRLVTVTKEVTLVVSALLREGYQEVASLQVLDDIVRPPPAFANGLFYIRSVSEIACDGGDRVDAGRRKPGTHPRVSVC